MFARFLLLLLDSFYGDSWSINIYSSGKRSLPEILAHRWGYVNTLNTNNVTHQILILIESQTFAVV